MPSSGAPATYSTNRSDVATGVGQFLLISDRLLLLAFCGTARVNNDVWTTYRSQSTTTGGTTEDPPRTTSW